MKELIKIIISYLIKENKIRSYHIYGTKAQIKLNDNRIVNLSMYEQKQGLLHQKTGENNSYFYL